MQRRASKKGRSKQELRIIQERRINFFADILATNRELLNRGLIEAQIIFYISTFMFSYLLTRVISADFLHYHWLVKAGLLILTISPFLALFRVLFILRPNLFSKEAKATQERHFNPLFFRTYDFIKTEDEFVAEVRRIYSDDTLVVEHYSKEAWHLGQTLKRHYALINGASEILIFGVTLGAAILVLGVVLYLI